MPRRPRLQFPGALYHVTTRGNNGREIFVDDHDRQTFLRALGHATTKFRWRTFAYCLMGNHYHLALETPEANLAAGMQVLNGWFARRFNWRHHRVNHLFGRRYCSEQIETEQHLLEVSRYVVRNPVRANLCKRPEDWKWSSYRAALGRAAPTRWLDDHRLLAVFGDTRRAAGEHYRMFVEAAAD